MEKTGKFWVVHNIIFLIILFIFIVFYFAVGGNGHTMSAWISFMFVLFAFAFIIVTPFLVSRKRKLLSFELSLNLVLSSVYFAASVIVAVIFIIASLDTNVKELAQRFWIFIPANLKLFGALAETFLKSHISAMMCQLILAGLYGILLLINVVANKQTAEALEKRQEEINYIKIASSKLKLLMDRVNDKEAKKKVEKAYDTVYSSPVKSHPDLIDIENHILHTINALESEITSNNNENIITLVNSILNDVNERNIKLRNIN